MTFGHYKRPPGPHDRGTYAVTVSQAQAAAGTILDRGRMRLKGWSFASTAVDTIQNSGSVTTPGAGATIVSITNPTASDLQVVWQVQLTGTPSGTDRNNFQLLNGAAVVLASINGGSSGIFTQPNVVITVPAGGTVSIQAIGAATVGAVYSAQIVASVLAGGSIGQILDAGQVVGVTSTGADQLDTEWLGDEGVYVGTSIAVKATVGALSGCVYIEKTPPEFEESEPSPPSSSSPRP
jgi:hypothetical protein